LGNRRRDVVEDDLVEDVAATNISKVASDLDDGGGGALVGGGRGAGS
jgi:hypothetical protein